MTKEADFTRLVIAAYRLPFKLVKTRKGCKSVQNTGGLVSAILALSENLRESGHLGMTREIAWAGIAQNMPDGQVPGEICNDQFQLVQIAVREPLSELYYGGFCNDLIWPLFHYFPSFCVFQEDYYNAYVEVNRMYCEELVKIIRPGDFVWVHDYQLMMLPGMIREKVPDATIGYFLHIPFPSFELFRMLPRHWRTSIIKGMLGADLVGFHTHDYATHFLRSVAQTTDNECHQSIIYSSSRQVKVNAFPIGIDFDKYHAGAMSAAAGAEKEKIRANLSDQKLIFSVDRLDYSKGLLLKLKGYEIFLEKFPEWHTRVVFNMVVVPSRDQIEMYRKMKKEIESTVGRINGKYSSLAWQPIVYQYKFLSFNKLVALYDLSDVGLITPLRDGMNLVAKEYVASQIENDGVLVLSEMAGAAAELGEALIINPFDTEEMANAIHRALEMKPREKHTRIERMKKRISGYSVFTWAFDFFNQTFEIKKQQKLMGMHRAIKKGPVHNIT